MVGWLHVRGLRTFVLSNLRKAPVLPARKLCPLAVSCKTRYTHCLLIFFFNFQLLPFIRGRHSGSSISISFSPTNHPLPHLSSPSLSSMCPNTSFLVVLSSVFLAVPFPKLSDQYRCLPSIEHGQTTAVLPFVTFCQTVLSPIFFLCFHSLSYLFLCSQWRSAAYASRLLPKSSPVLLWLPPFLVHTSELAGPLSCITCLSASHALSLSHITPAILFQLFHPACILFFSSLSQPPSCWTVEPRYLNSCTFGSSGSINISGVN